MAASNDALARFLDAQDGVYAQALAEIERGAKRSHWMWFVFPQIAGLGSSATSRLYAIRSLGEARAYLAHAVLGARLRACTAAVLVHAGRTPEAIFGPIDAAKFRSSMTLFERTGDGADDFGRCIETFFGGARDAATLRLLDEIERVPPLS